MPLHVIMKLKFECKIDIETKKTLKIMTLDEKWNILDKLRGGMNTAAVGTKLHTYFILTTNFPFIYYFKLNFPVILYYMTAYS
jgi:hypothetical protein